MHNKLKGKLRPLRNTNGGSIFHFLGPKKGTFLSQSDQDNSLIFKQYDDRMHLNKSWDALIFEAKKGTLRVENYLHILHLR